MTKEFWRVDGFPTVARWLAQCVVLISAGALCVPVVEAATFHVDGIAGADGAGCGTEVSPCATIQRAVDQASSGDTILVAEATYVDNVSCNGETAVVCVFQKQVTILGGFSGGDWSLPDPGANVTVIDGQDARRGVLVKRGGSSGFLPATSLRMEGFTVRNGRAVGAPNGFGGGLKANFSDITLRDMVFEDNVALGGSNGLAGGGGAAMLADQNNIMSHVLERVVFRANQVTGGGGSTGGAALGGGLIADYSTIQALSLDLESNSVTGGASATVGRDGLGGGAAFSFGVQATLRDVSASGNTAAGGAASDAGGHAYGGAIFMEGADSPAATVTEVEILDSDLRGNDALGGDGDVAGSGVGGGIACFAAQTTIDRTQVIANEARGGTGASVLGAAGGAGIHLEWPFTSTPPLNVVRNSIVADNVNTGSQGGGVGIRLLAAHADVVHTTLVDNLAVGPAFGFGILVGPRLGEPSVLTLSHSILADHGGHALFVQATPTNSTSSADLTVPNHFVGNSQDTNQGQSTAAIFINFPGSNILDPNPSTFFVDPSTSDYHVDGTQPPSDAAGSSSEAVDVDGASRSGDRDMGADEFGVLAFPLTVGKIGVGSGTVSSAPAGIDCGADCFENYDEDTVVNLTPTPDGGFSFTGWQGDADCSDGSVTMSGARQCIARFQDTVPAGLVVEKQTVPDGRSESFAFTGAVSGSIADGQQLAVTNLAPGTYMVTETDHSLFDLTGISCDDGDSTGDVGSATATFRVQAGETVTCVFTNTLTDCSAAQDHLVLPDETVNNTRTETACSSITAGPYTVGSNGDVTFESLKVVLRNGFRVQGSFRVVIDTP